MIERAGTSVCLSLLIVVLAALVLHRPERSRAVAGLNGPADQVRAKAKGPDNREVPRAPEVARPPARNKPRRDMSHPDEPFTRVKEGETFADVARRVYGENADISAFWKVNRDQLASPEADIRAGTILRTPTL